MLYSWNLDPCFVLNPDHSLLKLVGVAFHNSTNIIDWHFSNCFLANTLIVIVAGDLELVYFKDIEEEKRTLRYVYNFEV